MIRAAAIAAVLLGATPVKAQVVTGSPSGGAAVDQAARNAAATAQAAADAAVKTVNGSSPNASGAITVAIPTPANTMPPGVADNGSIGTMSTMYALANHTHASKARKIVATTAADGTYSWTFAVPFTTGVSPVCAAVAEVPAGVTDVVNVQIIGSPTATTANLLVNRANRSVATLLGLTVLSIPAQPGATKIHAICLEP